MDDHGRGPATRATSFHDAALASRMLGVLFLCGALLGATQFLIPDREQVREPAIQLVAATAFLLGAGSLIWASRAREWMVHATFAAGTALICLGVYSTGVATGAYSLLFLWLVVLAASFFSPRAIVGHVAWLLVASAITLAMVDTQGVSPLVRWAFGSLLLIVATVIVSRIVAGRRAVEDQLRREISERERLQGELEHLARHDPLTGLANRRYFEEELARELSRASRTGDPLCVIALDLDEFKEFNDANGHVAGDRLLKELAGTWSETLRSGDLLARMGGDEFVAVLPDCPPEEAERVVERLCRRIPAGLASSAGIASWNGSESAEALYTRADGEMYRAKERAQALAAASRS